MSQSPNITALESYRVPPPVHPVQLGLHTPSEPERRLLTFINNREREGASYLAAQPAYKDIQFSRDLLYGQRPYFTHPKLSRTQVNQVKHDTLEIVATYADLRYMADYSSDNKEWDDTADVLNKLYVNLMLDSDLDRTIKEVLQEAACSTGYLSPQWRKPYMNVGGEPRIEFDVYPADRVFPIQPGSDAKLQNCYGVLAIQETPIARAHAMYPQYQDKMVPDREAPTFMSRTIKRARRAGSYVLSIFGRGGQMVDGTSTYPTVDIRHLYIKDMEVNKTGRTLTIGGIPGVHTWAYHVPSYVRNGNYLPPEYALDAQTGTPGIAQVPMKWKDGYDRQGQPARVVVESRDITSEECLIYPRGRYIASTRTCILHDGPNPYWHGRFPFIPFKFDPWPGLFLGFGLCPQVADVYEAANKFIRQIEDAGNARLNPLREVNEQAITDETAMQVNPRVPGMVYKSNGLGGDGMRFPIPWQYYEMPEFIPKFVEFLYSKGRELLGLADTQAFMRARQMPASDSTEKLLELMGPLVKDRAREIESSIKELGYQCMGMFFQFHTLAKRLRILGPDGMTKQDWQFDGKLVPATFVSTSGAQDDFQRAQEFMRNFAFNVTPGSLHNITSMTRFMLLLQLSRAGVLNIDQWTFAELVGISNYGTPPEGATTIPDRWRAQKKEEIQFAAELREAIQPQQQEDPLEQLRARLEGSTGEGDGQIHPQVATMIMNLLGGGGGANGGKKGPGRNPSGQQPPALVAKDGGTRTTISESGR